MGKYALGNPKNTFSDRHSDIKDGDYIHVTFYPHRIHGEKQPASEHDYLVLKKEVRYLDEDWVLWDVEDLRTGKTVSGFRLSSMTQIIDRVTRETKARLRKLTDEEVSAIKADPEGYVVAPIPPYPHPKDIAYEPYGKYPKPGKPKKLYEDPHPGQRWRNNEIGMGGYPVTIVEYELWGDRFPPAVTYREDRDPDTLRRLELNWFKRLFTKGPN